MPSSPSPSPISLTGPLTMTCYPHPRRHHGIARAMAKTLHHRRESQFEAKGQHPQSTCSLSQLYPWALLPSSLPPAGSTTGTTASTSSSALPWASFSPGLDSVCINCRSGAAQAGHGDPGVEITPSSGRLSSRITIMTMTALSRAGRPAEAAPRVRS